MGKATATKTAATPKKKLSEAELKAAARSELMRRVSSGRTYKSLCNYCGQCSNCQKLYYYHVVAQREREAKEALGIEIKPEMLHEAAKELTASRKYEITCDCGECKKCKQRAYRRLRRANGFDKPPSVFLG